MTDRLIKLEDLHKFDNIDILAKQVVEGFIIGLHKSPYHGFSVEFAEHRIYNPGDPLKNIDWRVYGRTDRMYVKRFEEETNLRCQIIIDTSSSMFFPEKGVEGKVPLNKFNFSALAASALMYMLKKQRDAVGLSLFSESLEEHTNARSTTIHHNILTAALQNVLQNPVHNKGTSATKCLHQIADNIHKRSMVIIFSDMFEDGDSEDLFAALQHFKYNKHEVILFHVVDKKREMDFEFENRPYQFIDIETGEEVKLRSNQVKDFYQTQMQKFKKELKLRCGQFKIDFVEADINQDFSQVLQSYLVKREKMYV